MFSSERALWNVSKLAVSLLPPALDVSRPIRGSESGTHFFGPFFLQLRSRPLAQVGRLLVSRVHETAQRGVWISRFAHRVVGQDELAQLAMVISLARRDRRFLKSARFRHRVSVEGRLEHRSAAGPEAVADDFVRIRFAHERGAFARWSKP